MVNHDAVEPRQYEELSGGGEMSLDMYRERIPPSASVASRPIWSVMIPTYNCADYLRQTLESVLIQDPGQEQMQIEVVDDHSTLDDPEKVVQELGEGRIGFFRQPKNVGHVRNFNTCLKRSTGGLIHLLHGDDLVRDGFYERLRQPFNLHPEVGAAFCRQIYASPEGVWESFSELEREEDGPVEGWLEQIAAGQRLAPPGMVVRREVYERLGGFDTRFTCTGEDWEMWTRMAAHYPVWFVEAPLAIYRTRRRGSLTAENVDAGRYVEDMRLAARVIQEYLGFHLPADRARASYKAAQRMYSEWTLESAGQAAREGRIGTAVRRAAKAYLGAPSASLAASIAVRGIAAGADTFNRTVQLVRRSMPRAARMPSTMFDRHLGPVRVSRRVQHVSGPEHISYGLDELVAVCVVRNGEAHIRTFIEHHLSLGVRHLVFLDNGSTDNTVAIAGGYPETTVLRVGLPYRKYQNAMKQYLTRRFSRGRWNLCLDVDEFFDFPSSDTLDLAAFLQYLNQFGYTAVVGQMLDMFSPRSLREQENAPRSLRQEHNFYDLSAIQKEVYPFGTLSSQEVRMHYGGIRQTLFGTRNGLTKAPLTFVDDRIKLFVGWHHVQNARVADVTTVLYHYPFAGSFRAKVADAVATGRYGASATDEYRRYDDVLAQLDDISFVQPTSRHLDATSELLESGFLVASPQYQNWVRSRARSQTS